MDLQQCIEPIKENRKNERNMYKVKVFIGNHFVVDENDKVLAMCTKNENAQIICLLLNNSHIVALKLYNEFVESDEYKTDTNFKLWCEDKISKETK